MKRQIVPNVYAEYEDGRLGMTGMGLANVEAKIGAAKGGVPGKLYVLSGAKAKTNANLIFKGGPLLRAIEEAFDAGSSTIYAWRIGEAKYAELVLNDAAGKPSIKLRAAEPGSYWNNFDVQVTVSNDPAKTGDKGTAATVANVVIRNMNQNPEKVWSFSHGEISELTKLINTGQGDLQAEVIGTDLPAPTVSPQKLSGGNDGLKLSNQDYLSGLTMTENNPEISWIHVVGARTSTLWTAILTHCDQMLDTYNAERFAILETPLFTTTAAAEEGSAKYISDVQTYIANLMEMMKKVANRNGVVFPGGAQFIDSSGNKYVNSLAAACGGVMASLEVQKSLIHKPMKNVLQLVPSFSPGDLQRLILARMNPVWLRQGRGFIIGHSLTAAASTSDYTRVNDLRSVYYAGKAAREAAQGYVGEENDESGEGLRKLESAMARPLEVMRDGGQIDDFKLAVVSNDNDRILGDVHVELGIKPLRAMEMIYMTVYLK